MADLLDVLTLEEGKAAINTVLEDHDAELEQQITAVSRIMDSEVGSIVVREVEAEIHEGSVVLRKAPIAAVTLVRTASGGTITTLTAVGFGQTSDGYAIDHAVPGRLLRMSGGSVIPWTGQVEVTYDAGRYEDTESVDARFKTCAASILRRLWKRESATWAQSSSFFEDADQAGGDLGFYRVAKPIIDEMLRDELRLPGVA